MKKIFFFMILLCFSMLIMADYSAAKLDSLIETDELFYMGNTNDFMMIGDTAYIAYSTTMAIVDLSDINNPDVIGVYHINSFYYNNAIYVEGNYAYIAGDYGGLYIVDISDPTNPLYVGGYDAGNYAMDVYASGDTVYLAYGNDGLVILDASNPASPSVIGTYNNGTSDWAYSLYVNGNYAYLGYYDNFYMIDISDPTNPIERSSVYCGAYAHISSIFVNDTIAYSTNYTNGVYSNGLSIYNIANPDSVFLMGNNSTLGFARDMKISGNNIFIADSGFVIINVSDPSASYQDTIINYDSPMYSIALIGNYAYLANNYNGLKFFNILNLDSIYEEKFFYANGAMGDFCVLNDYAYLSDGNGGVRIIDLSDSLNIIDVNNFVLPNVWDVCINDTFLYIIDRSAGLWVTSISDPINPESLGVYSSLSLANSGDVQDSLVFVVTDFNGTEILNVNDPTSISVIGNIPTGWGTRSIDINGNYAYLSCGYYGLLIYDISDPTAPESLTEVSFSGQVYDVFIYDTFAYVAAGSAGVRQLNIADPSNPIEIDYYTPGSEVYSVYYSPNDTAVYLGDSEGIKGIRFSNAKTYSLLFNKALESSVIFVFLNISGLTKRLLYVKEDVSFTRSRIVTVSGLNKEDDYCPYVLSYNIADCSILYNIPNSCFVKLSLYDISGRKITSLINMKQEAGSYSLKLNNKVLKNGTYFIKGNMGDLEIKKKITIIY